MEEAIAMFRPARMSKLLIFVAALAQASSIAASRAEPPRSLQPVVQSIFPRGGRQGTEFDIVIRGKYLSGVSQLRFSGGGVRARIIECSDSQIDARVIIDAEAPVGRRDLRVFTPQGTFVQVFQIGALPEQMESEPNDDWTKAPMVHLPVVVNGRIPPGDYDHFRFRADAGQTLLFDFNSSRNGTRFDGVLSLLDGHGREIASQDDFYFDKDPRLVYRFAESGEYVLRVSGFREAGSNASEYRLLMGELPALSYVFPAGARRGSTAELTLAGSNLNGVESVLLDGASVKTEILEKANDRLKVRITVPAEHEPGFYKMRVRAAGAEIPNPVIFVISDFREVVLSGPPLTEPLDLKTPVIINGSIRRRKQTENFWIEASAGERITIQADGMSLGNFLDPAVTIFDAAGNVAAYIDESAPNGFDKDPPNLDFHLDYTFEKTGRYRIEMRDAGLRGQDDFVYRLLVAHSDPAFELVALTNQVSVLAGGHATLPVRVRRLGGWNTPVKVWVEGLPSRVESQSMTADPVNTRFRGTFGEDFFFDGTNVDLPLQAHGGASFGAWPLHVRARGTMEGKTIERSAVVFYPWQQTGYIRGKAQDQELLLTVASAPIFDLEGPASLQLTPGKSAEIPLRVRWFAEAVNVALLRIEAGRQPAGLKLDRYQVNPGGDTITVWVTVDEQMKHNPDRLSLVAVMPVGDKTYRKAAPDIELRLTGKKNEGEVAAR